MYNLFISGEDQAWETNFYNIDKSRFLEYTNTNIVNRFKNATIKEIEKLKELPCLFAYERINKKDARIGYLTDISDEGKSYRLEYYFDEKYKPISSLTIEDLADKLDLRHWELHRTHWAIKNQDLLNIINENMNLNLKVENKNSSIDDLKIPKSTTPKITTVKSYIEKVINMTDSVDEGYELYYRGHANYNYKLVPSLYRVDSHGNYKYINSENIMFNEMILANPSEFLPDSNTFEKLVRMQHYSLPTRLLDITSNPLIALYFACNMDQKFRGEVIIFIVKKDMIKYYDSDTACCISNMAKLSKEEKMRIDFNMDSIRFNEQDVIKKLHHYIKEEKPYFKSEINPSDLKKIICMKSKKSNSRIASQSGAFLLFGVDAILNEQETEEISIQRIEVDKKDKILKELDTLNINESSVFPYIESSAKYIASKYEFDYERYNHKE